MAAAPMRGSPPIQLDGCRRCERRHLAISCGNGVSAWESLKNRSEFSGRQPVGAAGSLAASTPCGRAHRDSSADANRCTYMAGRQRCHPRRARDPQCQLQCQPRGPKGFIGDPHPNLFSKLLIPHVALPDSSPSLSADPLTSAKRHRVSMRRRRHFVRDRQAAACVLAPSQAVPVSACSRSDCRSERVER